MTQEPTKNVDIKRLVNSKGFPCISIFINNQDAWPENKRAMIALKNQIKKAKNQLEALGYEEQAQTIFANIIPWTEKGDLWKEVHESLALFLSLDEQSMIQVDLELEDSLHIGSFFDVRALLPLSRFEDFYLLKLSQKEVQLFRVSEASDKRLQVKDLPASFDEFVKFDEAERSLQHRSYRSANGASANFHGHGGASDFQKTRVTQFAQCVAKAVSDYLNSKKHRLIVVALQPLASVFKGRHEGNHELTVIERDPSSMPHSRLVSEIRHSELVQTIAEENIEAQNVLKSYQSLPNSESRIAEILKLAQQGAVQRLYIRKQDYIWGRFHPENQQVEFCNEHVEDSEDLLNAASNYTIKNGGEVFLYEKSLKAAPDHALAILR